MSKFILTTISHEDINDAANEATSTISLPDEKEIKKAEEKRTSEIIRKMMEK